MDNVDGHAKGVTSLLCEIKKTEQAEMRKGADCWFQFLRTALIVLQKLEVYIHWKSLDGIMEYLGHQKGLCNRFCLPMSQPAISAHGFSSPKGLNKELSLFF
ncbi:hypothetical protein JRQ81_001379 [Phrynocephalus forsythii]|uniref:Uncharacterized protein n=1 Tax=Phrynocephalus forsythii TaxID=171643 RepID=A0A9Q0YAM8_9SAUR|nr:hypothetical protein JRQ81_001379 [Phrynocephalus forsythii]